MKSVGLLLIHGMGDTQPDFHAELINALQARLGVDWARVAWRTVFYQAELQGAETAIFHRMRPTLRWRGLRELMLYGFSDAASLEHKKELPDSPYLRTQQLILEQLDALYDETQGVGAPLVAVAQSLGGHVLSNYIWDAQQPAAFAGVWSGGLVAGAAAGDPRDQFRRLRTLHRFMTTGCNIPVFVAGHTAIAPIDRALLGPGFRWINQYDPDDVLGWPLRQLSAAYDSLVEDVRVNAGGDSFVGKFKAFTPYSHTQYWTTRKVVERIAAAIGEVLHARGSTERPRADV